MAKQFNWYRPLFWVCVIVIVWLLFKSCNKPLPVIPVVTSVPVLTERVRVDTVLVGKVRDSVIAIIQKKESEANYWQNAFNVAAHEASSLETSLNDFIVSSVLPDTCKKYQEWITKEYNRVLELNKKKDLAATNTITSKNYIISQKDKLIVNANNEKKKILATLDTCFKNQSTLEKAVKSLRPKASIFAGITATSSYQSFSPTLGLSLGYQSKKGLMIEVGANLRKEVSISLKRPILRF